MMRKFLILLFYCTHTFASELEPLYGEWGTQTQCARALITPKGTKHAAPFDVRPDWLGNGDVWCRLVWTIVHPKPDGVIGIAHGLCGEDAVREYQINFDLTNDELKIRWNLGLRNGRWDLGIENGPMMRCAK
jgi:hypothetical protein